MRKKYLILAVLFILGSAAFASEKDDITFLDELYKQKKFNLAINESETFLKKYPKSKYVPGIQDRLAKLYFLEGKYENAIKCFRLLLVNEKSTPEERDEIRYYLAKCFAALGNENESEKYLSTITLNGRYYEKAIYDVGTTYLTKEKYPQAEKMFQKVIDKKGEHYIDAILSMGLISYNKGDYNKAIVYLDEVSYLEDMKKFKGTSNAVFRDYLIGSAYYKINNVEKATTFFEKASMQKNTLYGRKSILNLIEIYGNMGNIEKVKEKISLLKNKEDYNEGIRILGDAYATKKNYEKAIEYYSQINDNSNPRFLYSYGFSLYKLDKLRNAQRYFESLKNTPYYKRAIYYVFSIDYRLQNYKKIIKNREEVEKVAVNQRDKEKINRYIANSAYEIGKLSLAKEYYEKVYSVNPNKENLYRIIIIDNKIEDVKSIEQKFKEYKEKYPTDTEFKKNIYLSVGELLYRKDKTNRAVEVYKEYLNSGNDFDILNNLVVALLAKQDYNTINLYLDKAEDNVDTKYLKGIAFVGMGEYQKGLEIFKVVETTPNVSKTILEKTNFNKIRAYFLAEQYNDVITNGDIFINTYSNNKDRNDVIEKIALSYFRLDNYEKAREYYKLLKENDKKMREYADFQIADTYFTEKKYERAKEFYAIIFNNYPECKYAEAANYWYLNCLVNLGEINQFNTEKEFFIKKYPKGKLTENIYILSSDLYEKQGNVDKVLETYQKLYNSSSDEKVKEEVALQILDINIEKGNLNALAPYLEIIKDNEVKGYYTALIYDKQENYEKSLPEYENLLKGDKYKDFAGVRLGAYYYKNKDYQKARKYYLEADKTENTKYKDYLLFQLARIDEIEGKLDDALRGYTKGYVIHNGQYSMISKLKAAQISERLNKPREALTLYRELYNGNSNFEYRPFVVEKMLYLTLQNGNRIEAKSYYEELKNINIETANKYSQFFN